MSLVEELKELLKKKKYAVSYAAKAINVSNATLHLWINNNYKGNVKKIDDAVANFIEIEKLREGRIRVDFVRTSIVDDVFDIAKTCHVENEIGVCCGDAGIGKTYAVKRYAIDNTDVILIEADLGYTPKVLFSEIHKKLGFDGCGTIHGMFLDIIDKLKASGRLIIIDEAEHLPYKSLELLRRIYDKARVGILLVGMPRLIMNLKGEKRQYAQLYSRVGIATRLNSLGDEDKKAIISSILPNYKSVFSTLSDYCAGNTRVLTKLLVRAVRIAEINNMEVNEDVLQASISQIIM
ncbi:MAG: AAA family ATPase [Candidatus Gastranaerophilales bacterium]|nr:AAA family ATPase [Candidatus Gastranaerophilales bacterium]